MVDVKIKLLYEDSVMPTKAIEDDACFDLVATSVKITDDYIEYGLGIASEIPSGWEGQIRPRSSISKYDLTLANSPGTIDAGYRGEWTARFKMAMPPAAAESKLGFKATRTNDLKIYKVGDRVCQVKFERVEPVKLVKTEELSSSERGEGGYGSTGQ